MEREASDFTEMSDELNPESLPDIDSAVISETEFVKSIDYTRPLTDYATASDIADFLKKRTKVHNISIKSLAVNGKVRQDEMEMYLANRAYNSSTLKAALKSPLHFFYEHDCSYKKQLEKIQGGKAHFDLGSFLHSCILEPDKFNTVITEPEANASTMLGTDRLVKFWEDTIILRGGVIDGKHKDGNTVVESAKYLVDDAGLDINKIHGKRLYYKHLKNFSGLTSIKEEHKIITDIVKSNYYRYGGGVLPEIMKGVLREVSMYFVDPVTGLSVRIRPDGVGFAENLGHNTIISVKSTSCESLAHFYYQTAKFDYELSEGMYLEGAEFVTSRPFTSVIMIMIQTVPPYAVAALVWNAEDLEIGKYKYRQALQTVADCAASGIYPGYDAYAESDNLGLIDMKQPSWNAKELFPTDIED